MSRKWEQIKEILGAALERTPEERSDFVRQMCAADEDLRKEIESLLSNHDSADSLLENPPVASVLSAPGWMSGRIVGAYRILRETGQGGMAVVYLAERADQEFRKQVAIKMVRPGPNSEEIVRRFRNERQTLAALDHPNIVKLLDGGTTEEGWPYLVMDFVDGLPVDQYCERHQLSIRDRLLLFRQICGAVEYAHQRKVIHRDLKPGNILITADGVPRLLDFGIAKLLDPELVHSAKATTLERRPMTPEYASPEQMRGAAVTNATDIYSLGVLLYELLTGRRPFDAPQLSWSELQHRVCEWEPAKPSTVVKQGRALQGDLDTIVMMALRKEPQRRYASAEQFAADIDRYLSSMPVTARRPTITYRAGKYLKRHIEFAAAATLVVAFIIAFTLWQTHRASAPQASASSGTRPAVAVLGFKNVSGRNDSAWLSTALSEMLTTELASGGQMRLVPGETVARAKIELGLPETDSFAADTLQRIKKNIGGDFVVTGSYLTVGADTDAPIRLDFRLQDAVNGETVATISETGTEGGLLMLVSRSGADLRRRLGISDVAPADTVRVSAAAPSNPEAMRLYAEGLEKLRTFDALSAKDLLTRAIGADPSFALAHSALAQAWQTLGYDNNASQESKRALDSGDRLPREDRLLVEARYAESTLDWNKAIETYRSLFNVFPDTLEYGLNLAAAETRAGKGRDAIKMLDALSQSGTGDPRIDLAISEAASALNDDRLRRDAAERAATKASSQGARLIVARARTQECRALANLGENEKTTAVCEEGRRIYEEAGDRGGLARMLHAMAEVPLNRDDLVTAEKLYRQALDITREIGDTRGIGRELLNLALIFKKRGDPATAQQMDEESLRHYTEGDDPSGIALATNNLANLLRQQGRLAEALPYYERSLQASTRADNKANTTLATSNVGELHAELGDLPEAARMLRQAADSHAALGNKSYYAGALVMLGQVFEQQGDVDQAKKNYSEALALMEQLKERGSAAETRLALAELYCDTGHATEAESMTRAISEEFAQLKEGDMQLQAQTLLSRALLMQGKFVEARQIVQAAYPRWEKNKNSKIRLAGLLTYGRWKAAEGDSTEAARAARQVLAEAQNLGLLQFQLEASLLAGEIELKVNPASARTHLKEVQDVAKTKGFNLVARRAAALLPKI
jgi:serine/threonine protein kinase/tetratricopeptide (TPR) repeat protein